MTARNVWVCSVCSEEFTAWAKAERHARAEHHPRVRIETRP